MTIDNSSGDGPRAPLSDLESAVMRAVWRLEPCTVEAAYEMVSRKRDLKETTVRTILRRLERKGYVTHEAEGRAYVYRSTGSPRSVGARAVRQIIDRFCNGSVEELVTGMLDAEVLSNAEVARLAEVVRRRQRKSRKPGEK